MGAGGLSFTRLEMIANPGEHPSILGLMCKVPWVVKNWPIQKLIALSTFSLMYVSLLPLVV